MYDLDGLISVIHVARFFVCTGYPKLPTAVTFLYKFVISVWLFTSRIGLSVNTISEPLL